MHWQERAAALRSARDQSIQAAQCPAIPDRLPSNVTGLPGQLLSKDVVKITETCPEELVRRLAVGDYTSVAVTKAYLQRAALAAKLTNCVAELFSERALRRAEFLDNFLVEHKRPIGPLHGLPLSLKENIGVKGMLSTGGFLSFPDTPCEDDALVIRYLEAAGAIVFAHTTLPQAMFQLETDSNIWGVTTNPYNTNLSSGGSTGGEGALIGLRGSCLGIGGDLGGSVRCPAANNGIFGLRPTTRRLPLVGSQAPMRGSDQIVPSAGPLSTSLGGIRLFMKTIIDQKPWLQDRSLVPLPWHDTATSTGLRRGDDGRRKVRVGVLADDGVVRPHPPIRRGIGELVSRLKRHPDIEVMDFAPFKHAEAWQLYINLVLPDGGNEINATLAKTGEPCLPLTKSMLDRAKEHSINEVWELTMERERYRAAYTQHWDSVGRDRHALNGNATTMLNPEEAVDVVLAPVGPGCASRLGTARYWGYTAQWNLLDYPALAFPTGLQCRLDDHADQDYRPRNKEDQYNFDLYAPEAYVDAPISLQLVGRRYEEEKLLEAMEYILNAAGLDTVAPMHVLERR